MEHLPSKIVFLTLSGLALVAVPTAYADDEAPGVGVTEKPSKTFASKAETASKVIEGTLVPFTLSYDPSKWTLLDENINPVAEYSFELSNGDSFAMILPEKEQVSLDKVPDIIIQGAKINGVENPKILEQEKKIVNGNEVLYLKWSGDITGITFVYLIYIYSGDEGTVQVVGYTLNDNLENVESDILEFLNGFDLKNKQDEAE